MPKVVEVQILDAQELTCPRKACADGVGVKRENSLVSLCHRFDDRDGLREKLASHVVSLFLLRILHVAHKDAVAFAIVPKEQGDLFLTSR